MRLFKTGIGKINNFRQQEKGLAGVEFALLAPVLLAMLFGSAALFDVMSARRQIITATDTLADVTARSVEITNRSTRDMFDSVRLTLGKYSNASRMSMAITGWQYDAGTDQMEVVWSRARGPLILPDTVGMTLPRIGAMARDSFPRVRDGEMVVEAEMAFTYQSPLFSRLVRRRYRARAMRQPRFTGVITDRG